MRAASSIWPPFVDWFSRRVLAWRLPITLEAAFCIEAVEEALTRYGKPDIFNMDLGGQFTSIDFIKTLTDADVNQHGRKGAWHDERLRRAALEDNQI